MTDPYNDRYATTDVRNTISTKSTTRVIVVGDDHSEFYREFMDVIDLIIVRMDRVVDDELYALKIEAVKFSPEFIPKNIPPFNPKIFHTRKPIKPFRKVNPVIRKNSLRDRRINKIKTHKRQCFMKALLM